MEAFIYSLIYIGVALMSIIVAHVARKQGTEAARMLSNCLYAASALSVFYLVSILSVDPFIAISANNLCIAIMDAVLLYLFRFFFSLILVHLRSYKVAHWTMRAFIALGTIDVASILLNPFFGHVATYEFLGASTVPHFSFEPHLAYMLHLVFCAIVLFIAFGVIIFHALHIPRMYRPPFYRVIACSAVVVLTYGVYFYAYSDIYADLTITLYGLWGLAVYLSVFVWGNNAALEKTCRVALGSSSQPSVIFDYRGRLFFANEAAQNLFPMLAAKDEDDVITYDEFIEELHLDKFPRLKDDKTRFYWTSNTPEAYSFICDYQEIVDEKDRRAARSLIFTNNTLSVDHLTGFLTEQYFNLHKEELTDFDIKPVYVAVCDLNQLGLLNNVLGVSRGDDAIALQAKTIQEHLPGRTIFVRLHNARLGAICYGLSFDEIKTRLGFANQELMANEDFSMRLKMDFVICEVEEGATVVDTAAQATEMLKTRKLLDKSSGHSSVIDSLSQMLSECDSETEGHVRRTRILGDGLAFELGLSDYERDQLSLLCLFHDIGKVGIPLNILNKPAPLNAEEQTIMREHVKKGYRIARATPGLEIVADAILHHHENWDGSGYPDGLRHEQIPVLSRIISVVDSYDAMVSDRPYRAGMAPEEACAEIMRCSGKQFDPYMVEAFVRMVGERKSAEEVLGESLTGTKKVDGKEVKTKDILPSKIEMVNRVIYSEYILDEQLLIIRVDEAFERLTGYTAYDVESAHLGQNDLLFEEDREDYWHIIAQEQHRGATYLEHRLRRKDGTGCYVYCYGMEFKEDGRTLTKIVVTDISNSNSTQREANVARNRALMSLRRLEENIQLDPMTEILNRAAFKKNCERELLTKGHNCVLVMFDIDDFKHYNDTYGHPKGDELLIKFAGALKTAAGEGSLTGRMGGDEFACLLKYDITTPIAQIAAALDEFWDKLKMLAHEGEAHKVSFSAGAVLAAADSTDFETLYERADANLYSAKTTGKDQLNTDLARSDN